MARLRLFASLILLLLLILPAWAGNSSTGTISGAFMKLGGGVRAASMGEAFVAVADDATAVSWNPAALGELSSSEISATYNVWLLDTNYSNIHYIRPLGPGTIGASIFYLSYGDVTETTNTQRLGTGRVFSPSAYAAILAWGQPINEHLSLGCAIKMFNQNIDNFSENGAAADMGIFYLYNPWDLRLGGVVQNLGGSLPQIIKLGAAKRLVNDRLTLAMDINLPADNQSYLSLGAEFKIIPQFTLRAGFNTMSEENASGNIGIGLGLNISRFAVDYGYVPYGDLGGAHRVGLRFEL